MRLSACVMCLCGVIIIPKGVAQCNGCEKQTLATLLVLHTPLAVELT